MGSPSPVGAVAGYGDVPDTWYTDAVQWSQDNGIANIAGFCFGPDTAVSRGETAVWIHNMEDRPAAGERHSFTDVTDASQNDAISWMANAGITTGTSPTTFAPAESLTRAQVATFLHRLAGKPPAPPHNFSDVVAGWQQAGVSWMANADITTGTSPTTFTPDDTLTRAELVTFLYRYQGKPDVTVNASTPDCDPTAEVTEDPVDKTEDDKTEDDKTEDPGDMTEDPPVVPPPSIVSLQTTTANGRCAPAIVLGIYDWENCAWEVNPNPELSRSAMLSLTQKVWSEMEAPGKPDGPPSLTEGYCGVETLGCYLASTHTIQLSEGFTLRTLLHELAHALVSESDSVRECDNDWTHRKPECFHGDLFRCAADLLYVRYGGLESSGVCGQTPTLDPGSWSLWEPFEVEWGIAHAIAAVFSDDNDPVLFVRCESNFEYGTSREFNVFLNFPRTINDDTVRIRYRFSNEQQLSDSQWNVAKSGSGAFFPGDDGSFLDRFNGAGQLHMRIEYGERDIERLTFDLGDSPGLSIVRSACR